MSDTLLAFRGPLAALDGAARRAVVERAPADGAEVGDAVRAIIADVRRDGDVALRRLAARFDGAALDALEVPRARRRAALDGLDRTLRRALERAASSIADAHSAFRPVAQEFVTADGVTIGRRPDPLDRVGVYAPGGRAAYPSSVLMGAVPARVAGVGEVVLCSPPAPDGLPSSVVLAAAELASVDRVFAVGGAGAIAALAFGTETVPAVARIVGPGNAYVAEAKAQVASRVAIDSPAGPSELLLIADASADAGFVVDELIAQAEHDADAAVVLVTDSVVLERDVIARLAAALAATPRATIARAALAARGASVLVESLGEAVAFADDWAPEHLVLAVAPSRVDDLLRRVRAAGTVFVGEAPSVTFGDYLTGANHVLPTGRAARAFSGLSPLDFVRWTTYQRIDRSSAARLAGDVVTLADAEGLPAHAAAAARWRSA